MPPRKGPEAEAIAVKVRESKWRYLLRYPDFRAELNELRRHYREGGGYSQEEMDFLDKWELYSIPSEILQPYLRNYLTEDLCLETIERYESFFQLKEGDFIGGPVSAGDPWDIHDWIDPPFPGSRPGVFLEIMVDLRNPDDVILSLISEELDKARRTHPRSQQRQRLDKTDFYLKVYDLAEKGETFRAIAKSLESHVSTVKSAYLAAYRNIYGVKPKPSKRTLPMDTFDWENLDDVEHFRTCRDCKKAKTADEMCPPLRLHVTQEHRGQRESTGYDTRR